MRGIREREPLGRKAVIKPRGEGEEKRRA